MTLQEAYDKAMSLGKKANVVHSLQTMDDGGFFDFYTVSVDSCFACTSISFEHCFADISGQDPAERKAEKLAKLRKELAEVEES